MERSLIQSGILLKKEHVQLHDLLMAGCLQHLLPVELLLHVDGTPDVILLCKHPHIHITVSVREKAIQHKRPARSHAQKAPPERVWRLLSILEVLLNEAECDVGVSETRMQANVDVDNQYIAASASWTLTIPVPWEASSQKHKHAPPHHSTAPPPLIPPQCHEESPPCLWERRHGFRPYHLLLW
jgi:hypothetical protein